jgi:hypothetical protein
MLVGNSTVITGGKFCRCKDSDSKFPIRFENLKKKDKPTDFHRTSKKILYKKRVTSFFSTFLLPKKKSRPETAVEVGRAGIFDSLFRLHDS